MWDLVGNPEDRFSHNEAHIKMLSFAAYLTFLPETWVIGNFFGEYPKV